MSYLAYKLIHLIGILFLFTTAGGVALYMANGGSRENNVARKWVSAIHGITLVLIIISGFGLIARLGTGFQTWFWVKLAIWFVIGSLALLPLRKPHLGLRLFLLLPLLGAFAAYVALYKPF